MEINIRHAGQFVSEQYVDVQIEEGNTKIDMGLLNEEEAGDLIQTLLNAASELVYRYNTRYEVTDKALDTALEVFKMEKDR